MECRRDPASDLKEITVQQDGPGLWKIPESSADYATLGLSAPQHLYLCQESSGDLADSIGSAPLAPNASPLYQQTPSGWTRKGVGFTDGGTNMRFTCAAGVGPNPASQSVAMFGYVTFTDATTLRNVMGFGSSGTTATRILVRATHVLSNNCVNVDGNGVYDEVPGSVACLLSYNRTAGTTTLWTHREKIVGLYNAGVVDGRKGLGAIVTDGLTASYTVQFMSMYAGSSAEFTDASARTLFEALAIPTPWVVNFDGPNHWYTPGVAADWTYLGLPTPTAAWLCQETSGSLADSIGSLALAPTGTVGYRKTVTGWTGKGIELDNATTDAVGMAAGTGPNPSTTSIFLLGYIDILSTPGGDRNLLQVGGAAAATECSIKVTSAPILKGKVLTATANGTVDPSTIGVFAVGLKYDRAHGTAAIYTDAEKIALTYNSGVTDGFKGFGAGITSSVWMQLRWGALFSGSGAEMTEGAIATLFQTLIRTTVPWAPAPSVVDGGLAAATSSALGAVATPGAVSVAGALASALSSALGAVTTPGPVSVASALASALTSALAAVATPGPITVDAALASSTSTALDAAALAGAVSTTGNLAAMIASALDATATAPAQPGLTSYGELGTTTWFALSATATTTIPVIVSAPSTAAVFRALSGPTGSLVLSPSELLTAYLDGGA